LESINKTSEIGSKSPCIPRAESGKKNLVIEIIDLEKREGYCGTTAQQATVERKW